MKRTAIQVENLSKSYRIHAPQFAPQETLLGQLGSWLSLPIRKLGARATLPESTNAHHGELLHWSLRDISFAIEEGESVGIIGHNGAGKSTLLKILSRITHPSTGQARITGRMASLLEVGTGFHPDLSGRDNVMLNGAILGMPRRLIARRFDQIVDFSGVEEYIDTPIKYYSSGMKVRLAFAVAAHLDPDILIVDEVLAVGDAAFQKKCLNRIEEVGSSGRTVLFVSHQLTTVARLCQRAIVLDHGQKIFDGKALDGIRFYNENLGLSGSTRHWEHAELAPGDDTVRLRAVEIHLDDSAATGPIEVGSAIEVKLRYQLHQDSTRLTPSVHIFDSSGTWVFSAIDLEPEWHNRPRPAGEYVTSATIPPNLMNEGTYTVAVALATLEPFEQHCFAHDCVGFTIYDAAGGDSARGAYQGAFPGVVRPILDWRTRHA